MISKDVMGINLLLRLKPLNFCYFCNTVIPNLSNTTSNNKSGASENSGSQIGVGLIIGSVVGGVIVIISAVCVWKLYRPSTSFVKCFKPKV